MEGSIKKNNRTDDALRLQAIIETATDGIIIINDSGIIEQANPASAQLFGYAVEEMIGQNIRLLAPPPHKEQHDNYIRNYLRTGEAKIIGIGREVNGLRKDGSIFPFLLSISEVRLEDRIIFTGIVHDLTRLKEDQLAIKREKERTQRYLEVANTIIIVIEKDQTISLINQRGLEILGLQEEEVIGKNWFELAIPKGDQGEARIVFQELMLSNAAQYEYFENCILSKNKGERLIAWRNAVIRHEAGQATSMICSGVDITEQRAAETRIRQMNAQLEQRVEQRTEELANAVNQLLSINRQLKHEIQERKTAEEALLKNQQELRKAFEKEKELSTLKSRFVSMASHEFRTPLTAILSSADLIEAYNREDQQPKRKKHTGRIKSSVANLTGILNDFLSLSRLEEGKIAPDPHNFFLDSFCKSILEDLEGMLKPGQKINYSGVPPETQVYLDKKFLKNIVYNLLSNALKYSGPDQPVDCSIQIEGETFNLIVADQGIGIPEEEQQHLFTRFFRAHNVENIQGTGLGLNIVKRYVEMLDGAISFESKLNKGTTFHVQLPLNPSKN